MLSSGTAEKSGAEGRGPEILTETSCPVVFIIVVNWNSSRHTVECLESVRRLTYARYNVVIVDNGSTDGSLEDIRAWACGGLIVESPYLTASGCRSPVPLQEVDVRNGSGSEEAATRGDATGGFTLLKLPENRGFTGANNVAIRHALRQGADWVFLLNNDTVIEPDALSELMTVARTQPRAGMLAPSVLRYAHPQLVDRLGIVLTDGGLPYERRSDDDGPLLCPDGCAALYSRLLLQTVECGGEYFDEDFFGYGEDVDLGIRARLRGFEAALAPRAIVYHKIGGSQGGPLSPLSVYLRHRNAIWTVVKDFPADLLRKRAVYIVAAQVGTLLWNLFGPRRTAVLRGKIDGMKGIRRMWRKRSTVGRAGAEALPRDARIFLLGRRAREAWRTPQEPGRRSRRLGARQ
jgi:GT2 family glycosyltransferase